MLFKRFSVPTLLAVSLFTLLAVSRPCSAQSGTDTTADRAALQRADTLLKQMTLDEKLQFIASKYPFIASPGGGAGLIAGIPRLSIPDISNSDSATGSGSKTQASTTFPSTLAIAASWDRQLSFEYGRQIAIQLRAQGFGMGLGGGGNLTRDPRGGRGFEYLGEDPELAGAMLAQRTLGTQSEHILASIKHFDGNEQETNRMGGNTTVDERTFRELYLLPFEIAVETGHPASVMCSYNRLNGDYACENSHLLNDVLKHDWNFQGIVQSDWGATHSTVKAINAGLDEEEGSEPGPTWFNRNDVLYALANHDITEARLDDMVRRHLYAMISTGLMDDPPKEGGKIDFAAAAAFAQHAEEQSIVLLRNQGGQLPLSTEKVKSILVAGAHADVAVGTGGGSGDVLKPVTGYIAGCGGLTFGLHAGCDWWKSPWVKPEVPLVQAIQELAPGAQVTFAGNRDEQEPFRAYSMQEIDEAAALAARSDVAVVVVDQPAGEDFGDLTSLRLNNPPNQDALVEAVAAANPHTIVLVESGNPVLMPWKSKVAAILEVWYPGEGGGKAIANVLFGRVNPSGKLPVTFPERNEDIPTWGKDGTIARDPVYAEKLDIGYRWYDAKKIKPMFEFGLGLSYTHFAYSDLSVKTAADNTMTVAFSVKNTGAVAGAEVPQVYLGVHYEGEPPLRLVGWDKIYLTPGQSKAVSVTISPRMQSLWSVDRNNWEFVPGSEVYVGASSRDIRLTGSGPGSE
jgi:beta-glucosidase